MKADEIKESGLLELYALGEISPENRAIVEKALHDFPELRDELSSIEHSLEAFAQISGVKPSEGFKENLLKSIQDSQGISEVSSKKNSSVSGSKKWLGISAILFTLLLGSLIYSLMKAQSNSATIQDLDEANIALADCDSMLQQKELELSLLEDLRSPSNTLFTFTATPNYGETDIALFTNTANKTNHLKINDLPQIPSDHAYQLWSLKDGQDPIPLTVFDAKSGIIPIDFEEGTGTYAITIEKQGGAKTPNLERLIATVTVV